MKSKIKKLFIALTLCTAATIPSQMFGLVASIKGTGMGAIGVAYAQDAMAAATNPAGIVDVPDRIDAEILWVHQQGEGRVRNNQSAAAPLVNGKFDTFITKDLYVPAGGINKRFCLGDIQMAVNFIGFNRSGTKTRYDRPFPLLGTTDLGLEYFNATLGSTIAAKYCNHSFGITINYIAQRFKVQGVQNFDNPITSAYPGFVTNKGYSYANGVGVFLGWKWDILPCWSVGVAYQPITRMGSFKKYRGFFAQKGELKIPPLLNFGTTYHFSCASISFDVNYIGWSRLRALHNRILPNLETNKLGESNGVGFGWRSQWIYRIGVDYDISCDWTVRAGCRLSRAPLVPSQTATNLLLDDLMGNYGFVGFSWRPTCALEISGYYGHGFRRVLQGTNDSIPIELGGGRADLTHQQDLVGLGLGWYY